MIRTRTAMFGALLVGVLLIAAIPAAGHERSLTVEVEDDAQVEIRSETDIATGEVDFRFRASQSGRPKLAIQVEKERENGTTEVETEIEFSAAFREVFEFEDANGNGIQDSEEARLSSVRLESLNYAPVGVESHSADGIDGFKVTIGGTQDAFFFGLVSYIFPSNAQINGTPVPEQAVKVDILLEGYDFTSDSSLLGLEIGAESTVERETEFEDGSESIEVTIERGTAFFRWAPEAKVDGQMAPVNAQWRADGERLFLYYSHGDIIVHDPMLGFELAPPSTFLNATTVALMGAFALVAVTVGILALRRKAQR